ncbi:hypothetical protein AVEN_162913-1 [Araneus ventricosus]|uniref:Uncharacterized protein n=1 Tax=Araneus ventricosus TaxID=182803 RepID=A0A4Y2TJY3_ARAVE|nr:hypothetical protein AVEN_162913-1 [Araneus ventricosus]
MVKASTEICVSVLSCFSAFEQGLQPSKQSRRDCTFFPSEFLLRCCALSENKEIFSDPVRILFFSRSTVNLNFCRKSRPRIQESVISAMKTLCRNFLDLHSIEASSFPCIFAFSTVAVLRVKFGAV